MSSHFLLYAMSRYTLFCPLDSYWTFWHLDMPLTYTGVKGINNSNSQNKVACKKTAKVITTNLTVKKQQDFSTSHKKSCICSIDTIFTTV
jgi:hypothetical protein